MPIYEYKCSTCNREWEAWHFIGERDNERCCKADAKRLLSSTSRPVIIEYYSENLGAKITGPKQKARIMRAKDMEAA